MEAMIEAVRLQPRDRRVAGVRRSGRRGEYFPGPAVETDERDRGLRRRRTSAPGSTRPAPAAWATTEDAVVGPDLRVVGTSGLRVADASIMPTVVTRQHQRGLDDDRLEGRRLILG